MKEVGDLIQAIGFPAFVALVLLYQVFSMHKDNEHSLERLGDEIRELRKSMDENNHEMHDLVSGARRGG